MKLLTASLAGAITLRRVFEILEMEALKQCLTCGRMADDWSSDSTKIVTDKLTKTKQRRDQEDRTLKYRNWRWGFGNGCYVSDIDQVEWRMIDGIWTPVAVLELSRVDGNVKIPDSYLDAVVSRYLQRDGQGDVIIRLARCLEVNAYIVLFRWDLTEFWVYNLSFPNGWKKNLTPDQYERAIRSLGSKVRKS